MKKRILPILLALVMVLSLMPTIALADDTVATVNGTTYTDLAEAINAAHDGDTVEIAAGDFELSSTRGPFSIWKAVSLEGAGAGKTIIKGRIEYAVTGAAGEVNKISVEGITFEPLNGDNHQALCWSNDQVSGSASELSGYELVVKDCEFIGWKYAVGVNSCANDCGLNVENTKFENVFCAASVQEGNDNTLTAFGATADSNFEYAAQVWGNNGSEYNCYYYSFKSLSEDVGRSRPDANGISAPSVWPVAATIGDNDYATIGEAVNAAQPGDTINIAAGEFNVNALLINKRVNLQGAGKGQTVIVGTVTYKFSSDQGGKSVTVSDLTIRAGDGVQGLQFRGDNPNNGYNLKIIVEDCAFEGWTYGVTMNIHANGYDMTVRNCDFSKCLYAVSYNYDVTTAGQEADNSLKFEGNNIIAENGFAVQKFSNNLATNYDDKTYDTIANFEAGKPTISGTVVYVRENLAEAISKASDGATIIVAPGEYDGNITFGGKSLTIKAQYPAYVNGVKEADASKLSKFTGTFNTFGANANDFNADQTVVIDGFAFSGNGLKVGNTNYNTVGNLVVKNCTMECGGNLVKENVENYNMYNYFVKVTGNPGAPYANVVVHHNNINGNPADLVTPIQLWDVSSATVSSNMIVADNANGHQAINISKMAENATVVVEDNLISGYSGGIYVTTWLLGGNTTTGAAEFTGSVKTHGNDMFLVDNGTPIFIGYEAESVAAGNPYGKLSIDATFANYENYNNGEIVLAEISQMPGAAELFYTVTYMDGRNEIGSVLVKADGNGTVELFTPSKPGYIFMGWKCSDAHTHQAGEVIKVTGNMTFTAIWANMPDITPGTPGGDDEPVVPDFPFTDVREGQWFYEAVKYVYSEGIMNGMDRYTFAPNGSLTRAMVWTMLARLDGVDTEGGATWYSKAQDWAVEAGVSDGTDPMGNITREQLVTMLWRLNGSETVTGSLTGFTDYDKVSDWAGNAMLWATVNGIIEGDEANALNPTAGCTRAQAAAMIMRFCENVELSPTV